MKKCLYKLLVMIFCCSLAMSGCNDPEIIMPEQDPQIEKQYMSLEELCENGIAANNSELEINVRMYENEKWTMTSNVSWCSVSPTAGSAYSIMTLKLGSNTMDNERTAVLTFKIAGTEEPILINVKQQPAETFISLDAQILNYGMASAEQRVKMSANAHNWQVIVVDVATGEDADWIEVDQVQGSGNYEFKITAHNNIGDGVRRAQFKVKGGSIEKVVNIEQLDNLETPQVTLESDQNLILGWDNIIGVDGYDLNIYDGEDKQSATLIQTVNIPANTLIYDFKSHEFTSQYVGMIYLELRAHVLLDGQIKQTFSNIVSAHNYFDNQSGDGSVGSEFIITKPRHINNVSKFLDKNYRQTVDIDMAGVDFTPISRVLSDVTFVGDFTGVYDAGRGEVVDNQSGRTAEQCKISNLKISKPTAINVGLFARIGTMGVVRNVMIENPDINASYCIGSIAGVNLGSVVSCHTSGALKGVRSESSGEKCLGGIVGFNSATVRYCTNAVAVDCVVSAAPGAMIGGVIGRCLLNVEIGDITVENCGNRGAVTGGTQVAGVIGECASQTGAESNKITIVGSYNSGVITANNAANSQCGGVVGRSFATIDIMRCYNSGEIKGQGSVAGILGRFGSSNGFLIQNCYNSGNITSTGTVTNGNSNAAGIIATNTSTAAIRSDIINCYNVGAMSSPVGWNNGLFQRKSAANIPLTMMGDCYALDEDGRRQTDIADISLVLPSGSTTRFTNIDAFQMSRQETFEGWDFTEVWQMGSGRPRLQGLPE